jgi:hypothetical protein
MNRKRLLVALLAVVSPAIAWGSAGIDMHRDPGCPCCSKWAKMVVQELGRPVRTIDDADRPALHKRLGIPTDLASCHTTIVDGYVFEGHVPIVDVKRLLAQRPKGVKGLAVAGMPIGSPGMEVAGGRSERYEVIVFGPAGRRPFATHGG